MAVDRDTVAHIAQLARLRLSEPEIARMCQEINNVLAFDEQLKEVDVEGIEPLISVLGERAPMRPDVVKQDCTAQAIVENAPLNQENFFLIPKVVD